MQSTEHPFARECKFCREAIALNGNHCAAPACVDAFDVQERREDAAYGAADARETLRESQ
jgi:hypothetical protein